MATYLMFGKYSLNSIDAISAKRTDKTIALIKQNGGELKAAYATLGDTDVMLNVELPNTEAAMKTSVALSKQTGIAFTTCPANFFTPRRFPALSRPLRELPPAFLCAMVYSPISPRISGGGRFKRGDPAGRPSHIIQ
jgi:uncharacterized protein with GYD domain